MMVDAPGIAGDTAEAIGSLVQRFHRDNDPGILFVSVD